MVSRGARAAHSCFLTGHLLYLPCVLGSGGILGIAWDVGNACLNKRALSSVIIFQKYSYVGGVSREVLTISPSTLTNSCTCCPFLGVASLFPVDCETHEQMFKASTEELALIAVPVPPSDPAATAASSAATPSPAPLSEVGTRAEKEQQQGRTQAVATGHHSSSVVRPQLLLLGDLSQAVGHAEAALVCASLLRDQDAAVAILRSVLCARREQCKLTAGALVPWCAL